MATLVSAGVSINVIDESFYGSAGAGSIPLLVIATAANKTAPSGVGVAPRTVASQANSLFLATSQRDLIQAYGNPSFKMAGGTPLHAHELNEYGLHAAYSYLGIANLAYILRADIDLDQLEASNTAPDGPPTPGTYWFDLSATSFGLFRSNGNATPGLAWESKTVLVTSAGDVDSEDVPKTSFGANGDYAIVPQTTSNLLYEKTSGTWNRVGSSAWKAAHPTIVRGSSTPSFPLGTATISINGQSVVVDNAASVTALAGTITSANIPNMTATVSAGALVLTNTTGGNIVIANVTGTALTAIGLTAGTTAGIATNYTNTAQYPTNSRAGDLWVKFTAPNRGADWKVKVYNGTSAQWVTLSVPFYAFNSALADGQAGKDAAALVADPTPANGSVYVGFDATTGAMEIRRFSAGAYATAAYEASTVAPSTAPADGTYWYSSNLRADIMIGNGTKWEGYANRFPDADPSGVIIAGSAPTVQSDGTSLAEGDLWLNAADLENYPRLYRWDVSALKWKLIDNTDQTTPFGIIFADARANSGANFVSNPTEGDYTYESEEIEDMLVSDFIDPDAPDARSYPDGTLLFNTRYSTYNVKVWRPMFFQEGGFDENTDYTATTYVRGSYTFPATTAGRWVTASGNKVDGSPYMGRKAQRIMVVRAMAEALASNEDIRSEAIYFNLMAAPGYPELLDEMIALNTDIKEVAFVVGDTPARMKPSGMAIQSWAKNMQSASSNGEDGLVSASQYVGIYYPWGLGTNNDGTEIMVPPSTIALRTIAYSDSTAYPWFAPAGFQRGLVSNAASVGYLTEEDEYRAVVLSPGQRDALALNKINPIAYIPGRGLVVYGQKTLSPVDSAMDRINVARLVNYLRYHLDNLVKPFLFEQNDAVTRDAARLTVERFLVGLIGLRGLDDFAVVCNNDNNTPERIDRNELWIDIVIKPLKAIEFIYIPLRIRNTGDSLAV